MYIKRELQEQLQKTLDYKEITAVLGPRQAGKTTIIQELLKNKEANHLTLENPQTLALFENNIQDFIDVQVQPHKYVFIDEIQYSKESGKKLKLIHDTTKTKILISGSSAAEIALQSNKYLVGRVLLYELLPFSFSEYLRANNKTLYEVHKKQTYGEEIAQQLHKHLEEFVIYGGYPRAVLTKEKQEILRSIYQTYILREVKEILGIQEEQEIHKLIQILALQAGKELNKTTIAQEIGYGVNKLETYLLLLEKTYVTKRITPYYTNKKKELIKIPKIYFYDNGFRNQAINNYSKTRVDKGELYENYVLQELLKARKQPKFWQSKAKAEVDFILEENQEFTPIEVKAATNPSIPKALRSFIEQYSPKNAYILSPTKEETTTIHDTTIQFLPLTKISTILK
ncbi:MAG: ATP-binding protein [Candidatus Woesearchaeota archaeon]